MRLLVVAAVVAGFCGAAQAQVFRPRARTPATIAKANANAAVIAAPKAGTAPVAITAKKPMVKPGHVAKHAAKDDDDVIVDDDEDKPVKKKPVKKPKPPKDDSFSITDD
jgi:hypothetical protein